MSEEIILYGSPEAAKKVTVELWQSARGQLFKNEIDARTHGYTHNECECGKLKRKFKLRCDECKTKAEAERYAAKERKKWDGESPLYSDAADEYFCDYEDILDYMGANNMTLDEMRLYICEPTPWRALDESYWMDDAPEDAELPQQLRQAIDVLNAVVDRIGPVGYSPTNFAADLE